MYESTFFSSGVVLKQPKHFISITNVLNQISHLLNVVNNSLLISGGVVFQYKSHIVTTVIKRLQMIEN